MARFDFLLEEFPLLDIDGAEACLTTVEAAIDYSRDGTWEVVGISLDGHRDGKHVMVEAPTLIHDLALRRLHGSWRDKVQDEVRERLEYDRGIEEDNKADMRRNHLREDR